MGGGEGDNYQYTGSGRVVKTVRANIFKGLGKRKSRTASRCRTWSESRESSGRCGRSVGLPAGLKEGRGTLKAFRSGGRDTARASRVRRGGCGKLRWRDAGGGDLGERPSLGAGWGSGPGLGRAGGGGRVRRRTADARGGMSLTPLAAAICTTISVAVLLKYLPSLPTTMVQPWRSRRSMDDSTLWMKLGR